MNFTQTLLLAGVWAALFFSVGVIYGRYRERSDWNRLIEEGVIPRPNKRGRK